MITKMSKMELIGPKASLHAVLDCLQEIGALHIEAVPLGEEEGKVLLHRFHINETLEREKDLLEHLLTQVEEIFRLHPSTSKDRAISPDPDEREQFSRLSFEDIHFRMTRLSTRLKSLVRRRRNIEDDLAVARRYAKLVDRFLPVIGELDAQTDCEYIGITIPTKEKQVLESLKVKLAQLVGDEEHKFFSADFEDGQTVALIGFCQHYAFEVKDLLWHEGISELRVPAEFESLPLHETIQALHQNLEELPAELEEIAQDIETLIAKNHAFLHLTRARCLNRLEHFKVFSKVAVTKYTFILHAWVPSTSVEGIRRLLAEQFAGAVMVHEIDVTGMEEADIPIHLENRPMVKPFELLLHFFPPPKYGTVDPSALIALFFPFFFGMILGDIAYGLVVGGIGLLLRYKSRADTTTRRASSIFLMAAFWTIVFGFLYGEFLGDLGNAFGLHALHPIFHREEAILPSFIMALSVGATHIVLGYILSMINSLKQRNTHQLVEKIAELGGLFGLFFMIGSFAKLLSPLFFASGAGLLVIALIVMIYFHNFLAPLEIVKTFGNILSYARIMAIGLSSVILATVANKFSGMVGNIVLGVMIAGLLHCLNIALGIFSPSIHSARLHYVEFFTKFYQAEGKRYLPFKKKGGDVI
ncbi:hypothetical protein GF339_07040 [candidate division KSB3 bacterium]|uniref:V-type ATP synthase subunit I n=1 Tax=candidate division KSB3 bacterium TaxID=2044937 RepID=A0A9D5JU73_9BACT|nr:hypothetical protein [candidate division KSB3 bacterium]MBD3324323.1 hypothetical protein [candidate division KSB3 bacterium]